VRGAARAGAVAVLALAGLALAVWFFTAGDDATTKAPDAEVPGVAATDPRPWEGELRQGNLVLQTSDDPSLFASARGLARDVAGAELSSDLLAAGQAIRVVRVEGPSSSPVVAYAHDRAITAKTTGDPRLRGFLEYWLGR
jgi:hypothetical protein